MLTGTLITAAGFLPIATAASSTGEYTRSIFQVVVLALILSWIVAVVFIPYLGDKLLPDREQMLASHGGGFIGAVRTSLARRLPPALAPWVAPDTAHHDNPYDTPFYARFRGLVAWCVRHRKTVILVTALAFIGSVAMFRFIPQQFFPSSTRLELMVDLELSEGSSLVATEAAAKRLEAKLDGHPDIVNYVAYVGTGSPRFYLPLDQKLPQANFAQFVLITPDIEKREAVKAWLQGVLDTEFADLQGRVTRLENGPPVGFPVQFRVSGEHPDEVLRIANAVKAKVLANPHARNVNLDWDEPSKVVRLEIDQDRARALGVSSAQVASFLQGSLSGTPVSTYREGNELIEILLRGPEEERTRLSLLGSLTVPTANGKPVPISQIARIDYGFEPGIVWHRNRLPTVTVRADVENATPPSVTSAILPTLDDIRAALPPGYLLETGGTVEDSARGGKSVAAGMPLFLFAVVTLLMLQLRSFSRMAMVLMTAPLGLIGVVWFLLIPQVPFGFVAMLGTIALSGMIMRNSVILVDQIEHDIAEGQTPFQAVVDATVRRFRPIVLTALAAVLAMIPLSRSVFFGPMAVAIMGGLIVATALTLLFLPALYAAWFRIKAPETAPRY
jgi:multidrug efflux pump